MKVDFFIGMTVFWPIRDYQKSSQEDKLKRMEKVCSAFYETFPQARDLLMSAKIEPPNMVVILSYSMEGMEKKIFKSP